MLHPGKMPGFYPLQIIKERESFRKLFSESLSILDEYQSMYDIFEIYVECLQHLIKDCYANNITSISRYCEFSSLQPLEKIHYYLLI